MESDPLSVAQNTGALLGRAIVARGFHGADYYARRHPVRGCAVTDCRRLRSTLLWYCIRVSSSRCGLCRIGQSDSGPGHLGRHNARRYRYHHAATAALGY